MREEEEEPLPSVWSIQRKQSLFINNMMKYKAIITVHGVQQTLGVKYFDTHDPVFTWISIQLLNIIAVVISWKLRQVNVFMSYPQTPIVCNMYLEITDGIET